LFSLKKRLILSAIKEYYQSNFRKSTEI
jgi:hypothetical protein